MITQTENYQLDTSLSFHDSERTPLTIQAITLTLTTRNNTLIECRLTFSITPQLYQQIDTRSLFNLYPELRGSLSNREFLPSPNIEITTILKPDLLSQVTPHLADVPAYLNNLCSTQPHHPLLSTSNWVALQVKQLQTISRTFWDYLNRSSITPNSIDSEEINDAILKFFADWSDANFNTIAESAISQVITQLDREFLDWVDPIWLQMGEEPTDQLLETIPQLSEKTTNTKASERERTTASSPTIYAALINFLTADDWPFAEIPDESAVQMAFAGKNGKWTCYAKAREQESQFIFYSICPFVAPFCKHLHIAEFITLANCGLIIGNFEFDLKTGEISYKTSIDVSSSTLTLGQIKQLVYTNVTMMDKYLPGISSIINNNILPQQAITSVESLEINPHPSANNSQTANIVVNPEIDNNRPNNPKVKPIDSLSHHLSSPQKNITKALPKNYYKLPQESASKTEILSLLFPEEIEKFNSAMQKVRANEMKTAKLSLENIKNGLKARLNNRGEEIFARANCLFQRACLSPALCNDFNGFNKDLPQDLVNNIYIIVDSTLTGNHIKIYYEFDEEELLSEIYILVGVQTVVKDVKSRVQEIKQMYRYWKISDRIRRLLQRLNSNSSQQLEPLVKEQVLTALQEVEKLPHRIKARLEELATERLTPSLEIAVLIEIEDLTTQLCQSELLLNKINVYS